ncbi:MAG: DinB family protein [Coleofasciculus sp. C2-GNP5-27]
MGAHQDQFRGFAKYNREFNRSLFSQIEKLSDDQRKQDMGAFFGSIHNTLNHILLADRIWLGRFAIAIPGMASLSDAHHRGQVATLLSQLGHDPGVTEWLNFDQPVILVKD